MSSPSQDRKKIRAKFGPASAPKEFDVEVPKGDPVPWQTGEKHAVVGTRAPRLDAVAKVTGKAKYTYDINLPGMLFARFVRCPYAHAKVKSVDTSAAEALPGVKYAKAYGRGGQDKMGEIKYAWDHVALVAATSRQAAIEAARLVKVEYEVLPHAARVDQSLAEGAPPVNANKPNRAGNPATDAAIAKADAALKDSDKVVQAEARTQVQTHTCLETKGVVAHWQADGSLKVWASTQGTFSVRDELADVFALDASKVNVICHYMGGGFGSKFGAGYFGVAAARVAKATGAPVKLMLDRKEEHMTGGNRPDSIQTMALGVKADGKMLGYKVDIAGTGGVQGGAGAANPLIYNWGAVARGSFGVATNAGPAAAFRAPGHAQGSFAAESIIDLAAEAIGMDPLEFRLKNDGNALRHEQFKQGAGLIGWSKRQKDGSGTGPVKRGLGVAGSVWHQIGGQGAECLCRIRKDGSVEIRNGCQDLGTGTRTVMAMVAAEELGIPLDRVTSFLGDTHDPVGPASGGSTTAPTLLPAARAAAFVASEELRAVVATKLGCTADDLVCAGGEVRHTKDASKKLSWKDACASMPGDEVTGLGRRARNYAAFAGGVAGCQFAEVEVDTETGRIKVTKFVAIQDCGTVINTLLAESQVNGAIVQGISFALFEERILDRQLGQQINADMDTYKLAGPMDMPEATVVLTDVVNGGNNTGVAGLGEAPAVAVAAAIAGAVHNAIGVRVLELPMTPDRVLAALASKEKGK